MGFVGNYAPCGLSPQTDGMPVIQKEPQTDGMPVIQKEPLADFLSVVPVYLHAITIG